jgi:uncharacterized membrane protein YphA (DoxX/SURF4 family)
MITFSRFFVGILFIISGLIKLNDPIGFSIKLEEYFVVFGMEWLSVYALAMSVIICAVEVVLGIALLFGIMQKQLTWVLLLMILFFTWLTGYSAVTGKVTDCGCFGDAIKLTPWQSFTKDVILLFFIAILFFARKKITSSLTFTKQISYVLLAYVVSMIVGIYSVMYLPKVDFLPYKVGNNIPELMKVPENAEKDSVETKMYYEKDGKQQAFTLKDYPWQDSTWKWVKTENIVIKEGFRPKIKDLRIADADGNDYSEDLITHPDYSVWVVTYDLEHTNKKSIDKIREMAASLEKEYKIRTIGLTASNDLLTETFRHENNLAFPYYYCDATTLKTMVRANPGIILLRNGTIVGKWSHRGMPNYDDLKKLLKN